MKALPPRLQGAFFRIPSHRFICRQCLSKPASTRPLLPSANGFSSASVRGGGGISSVSGAPTPARFYSSSTKSTGGVPNGKKRKPFNKQFIAALPAGNRFFPTISTQAVGYWLIGSAVSVYGIVVWGGLTRLTESGLSITEWRPVGGIAPPTSDESWEEEFARYRESPEFKLLNASMTLDEFKKIYFMEWAHRVWGRVIGVTFVVPAVYFVARRRVSRHAAVSLLGISALIGFQGFLGWWMVKSGLRDELFEPGSHPRVSQYRLAAHLGTAFVCYGWMLLTGLAVLRSRRLAGMEVRSLAEMAARLRAPPTVRMRRLVRAATALVFTTAMSGALVAGLDAGMIYNDFPFMGGRFTPPASELWSEFYSRAADRTDLWWRNLLENPSLVQLTHRILAVTTLAAVVGLFFYARSGRMHEVLSVPVQKGIKGTMHAALMQVGLGISTLMLMVPTPLAAAHQAGSLAVLTGLLFVQSRLRVPCMLRGIDLERLADEKDREEAGLRQKEEEQERQRRLLEWRREQELKRQEEEKLEEKMRKQKEKEKTKELQYIIRNKSHILNRMYKN